MPPPERIPVGNPSAAVWLVLELLFRRGVLRDRCSAVLVSPEHAVTTLQTLRKRCTVTVQPRSPVRAVIAWHQLGYPQRMPEVLAECRARDIALIEDCSDLTPEDTPPGVGSAGLACIYAGALACNDSGLLEIAEEARRRRHSRWISWLHGRRFAGGTITRMLEGVPEYVYRARSPEDRNGSAALRARRFAELSQRLTGSPRLEELRMEGLAPSAIPLALPAPALERLDRHLNDAGVRVRRALFDFNRNVFAPDFRESVLFPLNLPEKEHEAACSALRNFH